MSDKGQSTDLEEFLNPEALRSKLIFAALYISAFELLKSAIIERLKGFLTIYGTTDDRKYQTEVVARDKSPVYASLKWLKESNVIDDGDMRTFKRVKDRWNELAHTIAAMLWKGFPADIADAFKEMVALLDKIE